MTRGYRFMAKIVGLLDKQPMTLLELHAQLGESTIHQIPLGKILSELVHGGVIRIADWKKVQEHGKPSRVFGVGSEPGAAPPPRKNGKPARVAVVPAVVKRLADRTLAGRFCDLWHALDEPTSARDVAEDCDISEHDIRFVLHALHKAKLVRIGDWRRAGRAGLPTALWARGKRKNAKRPKPLAEQELNQRAIAARRTKRVYDALMFRLPIPASNDAEERAA